MLKKTLIIALILCSLKVLGWGIIGHRSIGYIAQNHLTKRAEKKVNAILDGESLAIASTWMDEVRSDDAYDHTHDWHWVTIPEGMTYEASEKNPNGDIIETIERLTKELKKGELSQNEEVEAVKMLIHLVGDIHQPFHVGTGLDHGGNRAEVKWFWDKSNLHRVWDSQMIESQKFSASELSKALDHVSKDQIEKWQNSNVRDWANESMSYRKQMYDLPEDKSINYEYRYKNWDVVELRILQAGVRLAGLFNEIYG